MVMTFQCRSCKVEWSYRLGGETRPIFSSQQIPGEAA
jgi:hypothetical protein